MALSPYSNMIRPSLSGLCRRHHTCCGDNVGIFWDYENVRPSGQESGAQIAKNLRSFGHRFGTIIALKAFMDCAQEPNVSRLRPDLAAGGVTMVDCPHDGKKNVVDMRMIEEMFTFAWDNPAPATLIAISGDGDFSRALSSLRLRRYRVINVVPTNVHQTLLDSSVEKFCWEKDVLILHNNKIPNLPSNKTATNTSSAQSPSSKPPPAKPPNVASAPTAVFHPNPIAVTPSRLSQESTDAAMRVPANKALAAHFIPLVALLNALRKTGHPRPPRTNLKQLLATSHPDVLDRAGVKSFKMYATMAEKSGIVKLGGPDPPWIELCKPWKGLY